MKRLYILIIVLISVILLTGCNKYDMYKLPEGAYINIKNEKLEVFKEYN